jgi:hypothetical protein
MRALRDRVQYRYSWRLPADTFGYGVIAPHHRQRYRLTSSKQSSVYHAHAMPSSTFLGLPDELVIEVMNHLPDFSQDRQKEMVTLSKVCHRFRALATERLLLRPVVHIAKARKLVETYLRYPALAHKVYVLELRSLPGVEGESAQSVSTEHADIPNDRCSDSYNSIIDESGVQDTQTWREELVSGAPEAYLGILLSMLPNLNSLLLAVNNCNYFRSLDPLFVLADNNRPLNGSLLIKPKEYLTACWKRLVPRLRSLEMPYVWVDCLHGRVDLKAFTTLQNLTMSCIWPFANAATATDALRMLPPSLHTLRLGELSTISLDGFLHHFAEVSRNDFPYLRQLTLYGDESTRGPGQLSEEELHTYHRWRNFKDESHSRSTLVELVKERGLEVDIHYTPHGAYRNRMVELVQKAYPVTWTVEYMRGTWHMHLMLAMQPRGLLERFRDEAHEADRVERMTRLEVRKLRMENSSIDGNYTSDDTED